MSADFFFRMGHSHAICQDYAVAGATRGVEYAILSDGCSGRPTAEPGSPFTDFGARLLVRAAQRFAGEMIDDGRHALMLGGRLVIDHANYSRVALGLSMEALDATLLWAVVNNQRVTIRHSGDGVIVKRFRDGSVHVEWFEFGNNMPFYLSNITSTGRLEKYLSLAKTVTAWTNIRNPNGEWAGRSSTTEELAFRHAFMGGSYSRTDLDLVLLMSDGAETFEAGGAHVPLETVVDQVLGFKNYVGQFIVRRCSRMLDQRIEKPWRHFDDFSCVGLYFGDDQ